MIYVALAVIGVLSGLISGVVGTGSSIILLPILSYIFGAKLAVPIMAIAAIMGNISRVVLWLKELNIKHFCCLRVWAYPQRYWEPILYGLCHRYYPTYV